VGLIHYNVKMNLTASSNTKRILLVDDHNDSRVILALALARNGYQVVQAVDGIEGLKKVESEQPDLIILDVMLPKMSGTELCKLLNAHPSYRSIPVFMVTARSGPALMKEIEACSVRGILTKPLHPAELLKAIGDYYQEPLPQI
jgi:CheY-like chemotaxis protein